MVLVKHCYKNRFCLYKKCFINFFFFNLNKKRLSYV